jgi:hypothetical protein
MDDAEFIADRIAALEESVRYFSSNHKSERERWVVEALLENMNIVHVQIDVKTPHQDPPDVVALGAKFEIKEILNPGRRRHDEYKKELERAKKAKTAQDLLTQFTPVDSSITEIFDLCCTEIKALKDKYSPSVRACLDLLFYVNLQHVMKVNENPFPDLSVMKSAGWRSVSFVKGQIASCFYAGPGSPSWLQERVGHVSHKRFE